MKLKIGAASVEIPKGCFVILVDNVDNFVQKCLTILQSLYLRHFSRKSDLFFREKIAKKNPQDFQQRNVNNLVDNVDKLAGKKVFSNIYNVSGAHSYQQIIFFTFF